MCNSSIRLYPLCFQPSCELSDNLTFNRSSTAQLTAVREPLCYTRYYYHLRCHRLKIFHPTTTTMDQQDFGRAFGFNEEALTSPPPTAITTRRKGKIPRSPIPQSMPQSTEQPTEPPPTDTPDDETDEDTYEDEQGTPTPIRKRPSTDTRAPRERIPQTETSTSTSSSLIDTLIAQNLRAEESNRRAEEANRQMMQAFMHTMERLAPSRPPSPTQPNANTHDPTIQ